MTEKQIERIKLKIARYKKALAEDKKFWGGYYHDGRGIRYEIPAEYIKLKDYKSGLRYLRWFDRTFPDDAGWPTFLFELTLILFKCGKFKEAEEKVNRTFFSNIYLFDKFLEKEPLHFDKSEGANRDFEMIEKYFPYSKREPELEDFAIWVEKLLNEKAFLDKANEFLEIEFKLKTEPFGEERTQLLNRRAIIVYGYLPTYDEEE
ncbi:MAG TPA: hypothetical protein PLY70_02115 [Saprospiraceae bacterium]|nr:hypothetical protein [Saprospiraceae bacterium]HPN68790.1 hypothetical protein [Saprospiraceae bacterium]